LPTSMPLMLFAQVGPAAAVAAAALAGVLLLAPCLDTLRDQLPQLLTRNCAPPCNCMHLCPCRL
jgi:hypothetical protein